jgi:hypothetical protein
MFFPHILQKKTEKELERNEYGQPIAGTGGTEWTDVCSCRCDDNTTKEFTDENGTVYRSSFHVVCSGNVDIEEGDEVRCLKGDDIRGEGKVYSVSNTNWFNRAEVWI